MTTPYKKALGPDRPNEKQLGKAISPPPCQRCVPIYPLRYGVAERSWDEGVFPTLSAEGYPELTAGKAYGLRVLRPGAYVYLCYFENGRMWTQHYQVTDDLRFARIGGPEPTTRMTSLDGSLVQKRRAPNLYPEIQFPEENNRHCGFSSG